MLLPDNIHPEDSVYFNGAIVLQAIAGKRTHDLLDLYSNTRAIREMSMPVFVLCLDWLFLLNIINLNDQGKVELCS